MVGSAAGSEIDARGVDALDHACGRAARDNVAGKWLAGIGGIAGIATLGTIGISVFLGRKPRVYASIRVGDRWVRSALCTHAQEADIARPIGIAPAVELTLLRLLSACIGSASNERETKERDEPPIHP